MSGDQRAFALIVADFKHEKYGDKYPVVLLNRKILMPSKYMEWQGKIGLFGGKVEPGETPWECAQRELMEELSLPLPDPEPGPTSTRHIFNSVIFCVHIGGFNQRDMTHWAGQCTEGLLDVFDISRMKNTPSSEFVAPSIHQLVLNFLVAQQPRARAQPRAPTAARTFKELVRGVGPSRETT